MNLVPALRRLGGYALTPTLTRLGVRRAEVEQAVRSGIAIRPRRGWIVLADIDPYLIQAARHGVVLSCITQAKRLGLWILEQPSVHVAARAPHSHAELPRCKVHWGRPVVPRPPGILEDPIENVLSYVASCQPHEPALTIWESALNKGLATRESLSRLRLATKARQLLSESSPFSDSGLETLVASRLSWLGVRIVPQVWLLGHRVDFLIGTSLVLQIDGGSHVGPQRTSDNRHDSLLMLNGYHVIRVGYEQVINDWAAVQYEIQTAVAQGLHLSRVR